MYYSKIGCASQLTLTTNTKLDNHDNHDNHGNHFVGTYMALSSAPLFLAKLPVGFLSGYLLERYCPEEGERHSQTMWLIIGLLTATSPILLTLFWGYVSQKETTLIHHQMQGIQNCVLLQLRRRRRIREIRFLFLHRTAKQHQHLLRVYLA